MRPTAAMSSSVVATIMSRLWISGLRRRRTAAANSGVKKTMSASGATSRPAASSMFPACTRTANIEIAAVTPITITSTP